MSTKRRNDWQSDCIHHSIHPKNEDIREIEEYNCAKRKMSKNKAPAFFFTFYSILRDFPSPFGCLCLASFLPSFSEIIIRKFCFILPHMVLLFFFLRLIPSFYFSRSLFTLLTTETPRRREAAKCKHEHSTTENTARLSLFLAFSHYIKS